MLENKGKMTHKVDGSPHIAMVTLRLWNLHTACMVSAALW